MNFVAVVCFIVAVVIFAALVLFDPTNPVKWMYGGFLAMAVGWLALSLVPFASSFRKAP